MAELRFNKDAPTWSEDSDGQWIEGYGATFNTPYHVIDELGEYDEVIDPKAFDRYLARRPRIEIRYNHSRDYVLSNTNTGAVVKVDDKGIHYRMKFDPEDPDHQKVKAKKNKNIIRGSSMAFVTRKARKEWFNGREVIRVLEADIREMGPVNDPVNPTATLLIRSEGEQPGPSVRECAAEYEETRKMIEYAKRLTK